jgi:hypothetical protein
VIDLSGSAYGTILASSLLAALSYKERGDAYVMIGALLATERRVRARARTVGGGRLRGRLPGLADVRSALRFEWPVLQAAWPAIILLLGAAAGLFGIDTAVTIALVVNAAILFVWGVAVARVHGATPALMLASAPCRAGWARRWSCSSSPSTDTDAGPFHRSARRRRAL